MVSIGANDFKSNLMQAAESMTESNDKLYSVLDDEEFGNEVGLVQTWGDYSERGSIVCRKRSIQRNDVNWLFKYALVSEFVSTASWKSLFSHIVSVLL